ncbi:MULTISPECIES: ribosome small subunit-dependent GTPase A [Arthrobacter]|uniref:Small ribosomal subunit biogenesis GTPase RsgA n=2 Tax=Arthrobacter TaxID=1663 RepID=A0ABU9KFT1_9MICC|nr:ribosome small subunit-dependent GTPase A [Arthrobacter sp. YJM1]MDP5225657.1 ribosome small subunit-dependent GTPase A [Arthrobacter sp. YJM1]
MSSHLMDSPLLHDHGWNAEWQETFIEHATPGAVPARVLRAERGLCDVVTADGQARIAVPPGGHDSAASPVTGDWITFLPGRACDDARFLTVLPRSTVLSRASAGGSSREQILAVNVDTVVVAVSLAGTLRHTRTERLLSLAWASGATPVMALTKADEHSAPESAVVEVGDLAPGVDVIATSSRTGAGVEELRAAIHGTVALIGPSGAGKSSLGNRLLGSELLATGEVRAVDGKGRHTTAWRELLPVPGGGVLLDTPGLRSVGVTRSEVAVGETFSDLEELAEQCRFSDCAHDREPGCAVRSAISAGWITERRLDSYRKLRREADRLAARTDARLRAERLAQFKSMAHQQRAASKERQA